MAGPDSGGALAGLGVLVTRPAHQAARLAQRIEAAGGRAILFPALEIAPPEDPVAVARVIARLDEFDFAIFISPNAVQRALPLIRARGALPPGLRLVAVGEGTARALAAAGEGTVLAPAGRFDSEALLALPELQAVAGRRILIFRGAGGRELLGDTLRARGAHLEYAECYRRVRPQADPGGLIARWRRGEVQVVTATSVETLRNLHDMLGEAGRALLLDTPIVVAGERQAAACRELGFRHAPLLAASARDDALLAALSAWRARQNSL
jgi:uroporphyrinogen-III synthase